MAIGTRPKPKSYHKKISGRHHRTSKHYLKAYWPYIPLITVVAVSLVFNNFWTSHNQVLGDHTDLTPSTLLQLTNQQRGLASEAALSLNDQLDVAAQTKAQDMVTRNYWSHITPDGRQPWSFIAATGYQYQAAGENLAYGFNSAASTMSGWMHSSEHRANILGNSYSQVGFGVASSPNYQGNGPQTVVVALYAAPVSGPTRSQPLTAAPVANRVSRLQFGDAATASWSGLALGLTATVACLFVLLKHSVAWRRVLVRGELFAVQHPWVDSAFVAVAALALILNHTVGFIH